MRGNLAVPLAEATRRALVRRQAAASDALALDVRRAMAAEVHLLLAHEMVGVDEAARFGCEFSHFFQSTPFDLLHRGIYNSSAAHM